MTEYIGVVVHKERGGRVRLIANRKGACDDCDLYGPACRSCLAGADLMEWEASNPAGAETGDLVTLKMPASHLHACAAVNRVVHPGFKLSAGSVSTRELPAD